MRKRRSRRVSKALGTLVLAGLLLAGAGANLIQMLVPMAASMVIEARRGRAVGNVTSGLILGILLAPWVPTGVGTPAVQPSVRMDYAKLR